MLEMVARVPSIKPGPVPELTPRKKNTPLGSIQLRIAADENITHVVFFYAETSNGSAGPAARGSLLRVANRPDLYPDKLLRFRAPAGDFAHQFIKDLGESDVIEEDGVKIVSFQLEEDPGSSWRIWACTLTRDGIPCEPAGPWSLLMPVGQ